MCRASLPRPLQIFLKLPRCFPRFRLLWLCSIKWFRSMMSKITMDRSTITKEEIARGYDAIVDKVGVGGSFYDDCMAIHNRYEGSILDVGCGRGFLLQKLALR